MPDSNPRRFARRLREAALNREPADTPDLRAAAAASDVNDRAWTRYAALESAVEAAKANQPSVDLGESVLAALADDRASAVTTKKTLAPTTRPYDATARRGGWGVLLAAGLAAALLVVVFQPNDQGDNGDPGGRVAKNEGPEVSPAEPEIDQLVADASAAYSGLVRETRVALADLALFVPRVDANNVAPPLPDPAENDWLSPVQDGMDRTLEFLFEPELDDTTRT